MFHLDILFLLIFAHFLGDYALQSEFMAKAKNRYNPLPGVPWQWPMVAHCVIHAGLVLMVTQLWWLALAEFCFHLVTDIEKCRGDLDFSSDQWIHLFHKMLYWIVIVFRG